MDELDAICQENQLARYPISRGRNSEESLFERYPELVTRFQIDRQRRIDSMRLSSRRDQDELYDEKIRAGLVDKATPSPSVRKAKSTQSSEPRSFAASPILKGRQSINDLMFQMDDETAMSPSPVRRGKAPMTSLSADDLGDLSRPSIIPFSLNQGDSLGESSFLGDKVGYLESGAAGSLTGRSTSTMPTIQPSSPTPSSLRGVPWVSPVISGDKRNLKDIITETSQSRVSNLTLGMTDRPSNQSGTAFSQRMSQRERKKFQQLQAQENLAAQQSAADARQSPWQMAGKNSTLSTREDSVEEKAKNPSKTAMTLRQTVAGASSAHPDPRPGPSPKVQSRSVSQPISGSLANTKPIPTGTSSTISKMKASPSLSPVSTQPAIQSIRHTPRPERSVPGPAGQASLASILVQQQAEKDEIREAATAKHNLQDIQAEQEFQQWWDQESKRVMEAEAAAAAVAAQTSKGRHQRRKNRGQQSQPSQQQTQQQGQQQGGNQPQQHQRGSDKPSESSRSHGKHSHRRHPRGAQTPSSSNNNRPEAVNNR
jgi:inhibitor of Bruton tyrosine kinase